MTDKEYEVQVRRIEKLFKFWAERIGMSWWRLSLKYCRDGWDEPSKVEYFNTLMVTRADWRYRLAVININLSPLTEIPDDLLEECFVHELCHVLISPMSDTNKRDEEEVTATMLAKSFIWLRDSLVK